VEKPKASKKPTPYERFEEAAKHVLGLPADEIAKIKAAERQARQVKRKGP
jgi:hypothetical protein